MKIAMGRSRRTDGDEKRILNRIFKGTPEGCRPVGKPRKFSNWRTRSKDRDGWSLSWRPRAGLTCRGIEQKEEETKLIGHVLNYLEAFHFLMLTFGSILRKNQPW